MSSIIITAGKPLSWSINFKDAVNVWPSIGDCELRAELRVEESATSLLIDTLQRYTTLSISGNDILAAWVMTGFETRALYNKAWGQIKTGYVNFVLSDAGPVDSRALVVPVIEIIGEDNTTLPAEVVL